VDAGDVNQFVSKHSHQMRISKKGFRDGQADADVEFSGPETSRGTRRGHESTSPGIGLIELPLVTMK
jgi:hypothetical protein